MGAKSLNGAIVEKSGVRIGILTTHLHAEYDPDHDEYLAHRVAQVLFEGWSWCLSGDDSV